MRDDEPQGVSEGKELFLLLHDARIGVVVFSGVAVGVPVAALLVDGEIAVVQLLDWVGDQSTIDRPCQFEHDAFLNPLANLAQGPGFASGLRKASCSNWQGRSI